MTTNNKGFSIVELSIAIVIMGLILGAALGVYNTQLQSSRISTTKQKEESIKLALINYITRNNRLPCPAISTLAHGAAGYGVEAAAPGVCTGTTVNGAVASGIIPWSSLGITEENSTDGYYNRYTYAVTLEATNRTASTIAGLRGAISIHYATPIALGSPATGNQSNDCTPAGSGNNPCAAVVVIVSHGMNGLGSVSIDGTLKPAATGQDEVENADHNSAFVIKDFSQSVNNPFDDIVMPLSSIDLLAPLTARGSLDDYNALLNKNFTEIRSVVITNAIANKVVIGPGSYDYPIPDALPALAPDIMNDPWGNPYEYTRGIDLITDFTEANIQAFTLRSKGPDGSITDTDDVVKITYVSKLRDAFLQ